MHSTKRLHCTSRRLVCLFANNICSSQSTKRLLVWISGKLAHATASLFSDSDSAHERSHTVSGQCSEPVLRMGRVTTKTLGDLQHLAGEVARPAAPAATILQPRIEVAHPGQEQKLIQEDQLEVAAGQASILEYQIKIKRGPCCATQFSMKGRRRDSGGEIQSIY